VQNSTVVFQFNFSNKTSICASISRPNAKPRNVGCDFKKTTVLKETFIGLLTNYTDYGRLQNELWIEIEKNYSSKKRHYHTLHPLNSLSAQLIDIKKEIQNWNTILFTLYYHDMVCNSLKSDNEEKSAELAEKQMKQISVSIDKIELCKNQILATKSHIFWQWTEYSKHNSFTKKLKYKPNRTYKWKYNYCDNF
jgi:hypothetical protein